MTKDLRLSKVIDKEILSTFEISDDSEPVDVEVSGLAADSLGARRLGKIGWQALAVAKAESCVVSDEEVREAQALLLDKFDVVAEPAASAGYAALRTGRAQIADSENCVLIICGSNTK